MKALTYQSSRNVGVETVPDPVLEQEDDVVLRVTATAICGSDLHVFRDKIPDMESGDILGHEFMGVVEEAGRGVTRLKKGDRVVMPFPFPAGNASSPTRRCSLPARPRARDAAPSSTRRTCARVPGCSGTPTFMAATLAARLNSCAFPKPTWARSSMASCSGTRSRRGSPSRWARPMRSSAQVARAHPGRRSEAGGDHHAPHGPGARRARL
ncbi:Alcohol dehydrogenase GroES-associated [Variovorax sp. OK212]|nr:Alcohol dehydrogenase GroES-associated [Variovorax sp. OK202]SFE61620.1 Alcohol dehydrogenase GroES-associated [Variovorax sp. OK212]